MKLFIWEGEGISSAYHDDGTLVVLAETAEAARLLVRDGVPNLEQIEDDYEARRQAWVAANPKPPNAFGPGYWNRQLLEVPYPAELAESDLGHGFWDGSDEALDREPDRVIELDTPSVVAFNGGGYD